MASCTRASIFSAIVGGLLVTLAMPPNTPDNELIKANKALQDRLLQLADSSAKAYDEAKKALEEEKKRVAASCQK